MVHLKNIGWRCLEIRVEDAEGKVFMDQDTSSGCNNAEWKMCVPRNGRVRIIDNVHCGGQKNRASYLPWALLKSIPTSRKVEVSRDCKNSYPRYKIEGNTFYADARPANDNARNTTIVLINKSTQQPIQRLQGFDNNKLQQVLMRLINNGLLA